jgi:hypothetical protein
MSLDVVEFRRLLSERVILRGFDVESIIAGLPSVAYRVDTGGSGSPEAVARGVWNFLNSRPGRVRHSGSRPLYGPADTAAYLERIRRFIAEGSPIEAYFLCLSPKYTNPLVSGKDLSQDMGLLLAFRQLCDLSRSVRAAYPPGMRFFIL